MCLKSNNNVFKVKDKLLILVYNKNTVLLGHTTMYYLSLSHGKGLGLLKKSALLLNVWNLILQK